VAHMGICLYYIHVKVYWTNTGKYFHTILIVDFLILNDLITPLDYHILFIILNYFNNLDPI
ncbi:MAG: hypothetical protein ACRD6U_02175, partial [Nitrososphaeraceae archaeon]